MPALPSYVKLLRDDAREGFDPGVLVSEMERGLGKTRITDHRVKASVPVTLLFRTKAESVAFETWYFEVIKRAGFFDWRNPRTGQVHSVRFKGGALGELVPLKAGFAASKRTATLEYLR